VSAAAVSGEISVPAMEADSTLSAPGILI